MATRNPWPELGWRAFTLSVEAASVMALRTLRLSAGGAAAAVEAQRMVQEKLEAAWTLQAKAVSGALGGSPARVTAKTIAHYRPKVRANARRLARRGRKAK